MKDKDMHIKGLGVIQALGVSPDVCEDLDAECSSAVDVYAEMWDSPFGGRMRASPICDCQPFPS